MPRFGHARHGQEEKGQGPTACLARLAHAHSMASAGQWESLAGFERNYMVTFGRLKADMEAVGPVPEEGVSPMRKLEQEQRRLARLIRRRQQVIRDQLRILDDDRTRLQRVKHLSRTIAGV